MGRPPQAFKPQIMIEERTLSEPSSENGALSEVDKPSRPWKPFTLRQIVLVPAMLVTAGLIIILGLLQWQNAKNGALFLVPADEDFSNLQNFLYRYLPTILIVLYGVGWSWIDLDVKRLEPWFQLSDRDGATAKHSLLLDYPVDFLPLVPFKAARCRQWVVLSASTIMLCIVWAVTPLQNGIFNNDTLERSSTAAMLRSNSLLQPKDQSKILSARILNEAYSTTWLGQKLPPFTTAAYTLAPFEMTGDHTLAGTDQTLTAVTTQFWTDLECQLPARFSVASGTVTLDDGSGCVAQNIISYPDQEFSKHFISYYIGYWNDPNADASLQLAGCSSQAENTFLAIWKRAGDGPPDFLDQSNATALFCKASYYSQSVNATIAGSDKSVISATSLDEKKSITKDIFNITRFEYILANGATDDTSRLDVLDSTVLHQDTQVANMSLVIPVPNMIALAIGATHYLPEEYLQPETLASALQSAHRAAFAIAAQSVMTAPEGTLVNGNIGGVFQAVSIVTGFALLSQVFLFIVLASTVLLLILTIKRPCLLSEDPSNLAQIMLLARSERIRRLFTRYDSADDSKLAKALEPYQFGLRRDPPSTCPAIDIDAVIVQSQVSDAKESQTEEIARPRGQRFVEPYEYKSVTGLGMSTVLLGLIAVLIMLRQKALAEGGLNLPSGNNLVQQLLLNFIPTSIATLMEPFWVLLTRLGCLMVPMEELRKGNSPARFSLLSSYTSLPPQLVVLRSFRSGHFLLASLCGLALLSNVLTVTLSGLFSINDVFHPVKFSVKPLYTAQFPPLNNSGESFVLGLYNQNDAFYVAASNFSSGTPLPAWTTPGEYFLPLDFDNSGSPADQGQWEVQMAGYGADLDCVELTESPSDAMYEFDLAPNPQFARMKMKYRNPDGSTLECKPTISELNATGQLPPNALHRDYAAIGGTPFGKTAFEVAVAMVSLDSVGSDAAADPCTPFIVRGWVHANAVAQVSNPNSTSAAAPLVDDVSSSFISCKIRPRSAVFNTTLSSAGSILSLTQASPTTYTASEALSFALNETRNNLNSNTVPVWHNDTIATDFTNNLLKLLTNSTALLDATLPPPSPAHAANLTSTLFTRLFAIQMSLSAPQLAPATLDTPRISATRLIPQRRVFLSERLFWISIAILALDLLVLVIFYTRLPSPFLPRLPTSIASQIAFFAGSRVVDDVQRAGGDVRALDKKGFRYGYGRFVGWDGWSHTGIERVPFVVGMGEKGRKSKSGR